MSTYDSFFFTGRVSSFACRVAYRARNIARRLELTYGRNITRGCIRPVVRRGKSDATESTDYSRRQFSELLDAGTGDRGDDGGGAISADFYERDRRS